MEVFTDRTYVVRTQPIEHTGRKFSEKRQLHFDLTPVRRRRKRQQPGRVIMILESSSSKLGTHHANAGMKLKSSEKWKGLYWKKRV